MNKIAVKYLVLIGIFVGILVLAGCPERVSDANLMRQQCAPKDVRVLNYHKVDDMNISLSISPVEFEKQMAYLKNNGYHTISPQQLTDYLEHGSPLPQKPIMITFDDGYADNYTNAYPIMKKYGMVGTIFLITNLVGFQNYLTWDQVREMKANGFSFGSHTVNHIPLAKASRDVALYEMVQSRKDFMKYLQEEPDCIAYPTGDYSVELLDLVKEAGYETAYTIRYGMVGSASNLYALERIPIFRTENTYQNFRWRVEMAPVSERFGIVRN